MTATIRYRWDMALARVCGVWQLIREGPGNIDTPEARGRDRLRRVALTGIATAIATSVAVLVSLISIPLTVNYLGPGRYGVWLTISSLLSWLAITDMGFGSLALINLLAEARGRDDIKAARSLISTALIALCGIAGILTLLFFLSYPYVPWPAVFNAKDVISSSELTLSVEISFCIFALMFPTSLLNAVYSGYQEGYIGAAWNTAVFTWFYPLLSLIVVVHFKGGLPLLVLAISGARLLVLMLSIGYLFYVRHTETRPCLSFYSFKHLKRLVTLGWKYLVQQFAAICMFQSQPIMITQFLGPQQVGVFNVAQRILTLPLTFVGFFSYPLVPAYGEAKARNDWPWIWRTLRRSMVGSIGAALVLVLPLALITIPLIDRWVGRVMVPPPSFVIPFAGYVILNASITPLAAFFSGIEWVGWQAAISLVNAVVTVGLASCFCRPCKYREWDWPWLWESS